MALRVYKGLSLNNIDPHDPAFGVALRSALNEIDLFLRGVNRELSPTQGGSTTSSGASNTESYVVASPAADLPNDRTLAASSPLSISDGGAGASITVGLTGTVPVANGGTGATTAAAGRANLGADRVLINSVDRTDININDLGPAAPADGFNIRFQSDASSASNVSGNVPVATPTFTLSTVSSAGGAATGVRSDATIAAFDATNPTTISATVSSTPGTAQKAARRDHAHGITTAAPNLDLNTFNAVGSASSVIRTDASIALFDGNWTDLSGTGAGGSAAFAARSDHVHRSRSDNVFLCGTAQTGFVSKDTQGTARYWAIYVDKGATNPSGDATINIDSAGVITCTRAGGAAGDIIIKIKDLGTSAPI